MSIEDVRVEYNSITAYTVSTVNSRFTIAGLYMAASGFLAGAVFKEGLPKSLRFTVCIFACLVTASVWILELRARSLLSIISKRARDIEKNDFGLSGENAYAGFLSRQSRVPEELAKQHGSEHDFAVFGFSSHRLPKWILKRVSHSFALDLLYASGAVLWLVLAVSFLCGVSAHC